VRLVVNIWPLVERHDKIARSYNEREREVLQAISSFRLRHFKGSGQWDTKDVHTYSQALYNIGQPQTGPFNQERTLIYAVSDRHDERRCATLPTFLNDYDRAELSWWLFLVGAAMMPKQLVDLELYVKHETERAVLVENLHGQNVWLPKSLIEMEPMDKQNWYEITLPQWLAEQTRLV